MDYSVTLTAWGYKYGQPPQNDLAFDVRNLSNPYGVFELRVLSGFDEEVQSYVSRSPDYRKTFTTIVESVLSEISSGSEEVSVIIGCTGGRHRSVSVVVKVAKVLESLFKDRITIKIQAPMVDGEVI